MQPILPSCEAPFRNNLQKNKTMQLTGPVFFLQIAPKGGVLRMTVRLVAFSSKKPNEAPLSKLYQLPSLLCSVPLMTNEKSISYAL